VLRGGILDPALIRIDAQRMHDIYGNYGISVFVHRGTTIDELAQEAPLIRFPELTLVTVGAIRDAGLSLEATGRNPNHFTVMLSDLGAAVDALLACEHRVWPNPYHDG